MTGGGTHRSTPIFRAPMRSRERDDVPPGAGAEHGLRTGAVGIGRGRGLERFAGLPDGAFVWTRDTDGLYHLGRISGPLRRDESPAVAATFARGGRNFQRTHDAAAERLTAELWERYG